MSKRPKKNPNDDSSAENQKIKSDGPNLDKDSSNQNNNNFREAHSPEMESLNVENMSESSVSKHRVRLVTKLLVDMKSGLMEDLNYSPDMSKIHDGSTTTDINEGNSEKEEDKRKGYMQFIPMQEQQTAPKISKGARLRAERVRIYLDYYYTMFEGVYRFDRDENGEQIENIHKNVEGVYNPLQIIRNRKLRKKYHDEAFLKRFLFYKSPTIAILEFSKYPNRKKYRWFVDVNEKYSDFNFRAQHWNELVDPHGNLWFGNTKRHKLRLDGNKDKKSHRDSHLKPHLHHNRTKSGRSEISENTIGSKDSDVNLQIKLNPKINLPTVTIESEYPSNNNSINSYSNSESEKDLVSKSQNISDVDLKKDNTHLNKFEKIINKTKKAKQWSRSRSPKKQSYDYTMDNDDIDQINNISNVVPLELNTENLNKREEYRGSVSGPSGKYGSNKYMTPIDGTSAQRLSVLEDIPIRKLKSNLSRKQSLEPTEDSHRQKKDPKYDPQVHNIEHNRDVHEDEMNDKLHIEGIPSRDPHSTTGKDNQSSTKPGREISPVSKETSTLDELPVDLQLQKYWRDTRYVISTISIMEHRRQTHELVKKRAIQNRNLTEIDNDTDKNMSEAENIIEEYSDGLDRVLKIGNEWSSKLLNDYSIRVDTLISASDRILSDINTTLTLKLKLFQENTDRFGTIRTMQSQKMTKVIYRLLEFFIVLILWTIWLIVSIIREIRHGIVLILRFIKWLIW